MPSAIDINMLPEHLKRYVRELETIADYNCIIWENMQLKDENESLRAYINENSIAKGNSSSKLESSLNDLLCCPFCGCEPSFYKGTNVDCMTQDNRPVIGCVNCKFWVHKSTLTEAKKWWNSRAV